MSETQSFPIDETIDRRAFVGVIETYVPLVKDGARFRSYCPLCHNDAHSYRGFILDPEKLEWSCEDCGEKGGITYFFEKLRRIPGDEAARFAEMLSSNHKFHTPMASGLSQRPRVHAEHDTHFKPEAAAAAATINAYAGKPLIPEEPETTDTPDAEAPKAEEDQAPMVPEPQAAESTAAQSIGTDEPAPVEPAESVKTTEEPPAADNPPPEVLNRFAEGLLKMFEGRPGFRGIAVINRQGEQLLGSSLKTLVQKDVKIINDYMKSILPEIKKILGEYEVDSANTSLSMGVRLDSEDLKLVWIPLFHHRNVCDVLLLLEHDVAWSMYVRQLDSYCAKHNQEWSHREVA